MSNARALPAQAARCAALVATLHCLVPATSIAAKAPWTLPQAVSPAPESPQGVSGPSLWHVVDSSVDPAQRPAFLLRGTHALWCGTYNPCWVIPVGYGNIKYEILYVDTGDHAGPYTLNVTMNSSTEYVYDFLYLIGGGGGAIDPLGNSASLIDEVIFNGSSGNARMLVSWTGSIKASTPGATSIDTTPGPVNLVGDTAGQPDSLTATITIPSGNRALYFVFRSDCIFSQEDGQWPFGSGVLLDDLKTSDHGAIYTEAAAAGGTDALGGSVIVGTPGAPVVSSRKIFTGIIPPVVTPPAAQIKTEGDAVSMTATVTDPDPFALFGTTVCGYPAGLAVSSVGQNPRSVTVSGTLPCGASAQSPYTIRWSANKAFAEASATATLTVLPNPHAPVVTAPASITRAVGSVVQIAVLASDPDGDAITTLTADLSDIPSGATFVPEPGNRRALFTWTPSPGDVGNHRVGSLASNALQGCAGTMIHIVPGGATAVEADALSPAAPSLEQNRPNPFNPQTSIRVNLPRETHVRLDIFDVHGRRVIGLVDGVVPSGPRDVSWDGRDAHGSQLPSGIYLYRMEAAGVSLSHRMVLLR